MLLLLITTLIWSFSFSLIGVYLSGQVDNGFAVLIRILLAFLVFIPYCRWRGFSWYQLLCYMSVGACQLGLMYLFYYAVFLYLTVAELLLFTVLTPIYITLIYDLLSARVTRGSYLLTALLAVAGAAVIRYQQPGSQFWFGFMLIQGANLCFALGQVGYKQLMQRYPMPQQSAFFWFYAGALCISALAWWLWGDSERLPTTAIQWGILFWLGIVASGLGFFMWNYGATSVDAGVLAIINNVLIPAGLLVNFLLWHHTPDWGRFISGTLLILLALWAHYRWNVPRDVQKVNAHQHASASKQ